MVNDERPATFQIPGRGTFEDHVKYHQMLLNEYFMTLDRVAEVHPISPVHQKRMHAVRLIRRRVIFHYTTAMKQLGGVPRHLFRAMFKGRI